MFLFYRILCLLATPLYGLLALYRLIKGKEECKCIGERFGIIPKAKRPPSSSSSSSVIWVHCASVGETISALSFVHLLHDKHPHSHFVITTYTKTAAQIVKRLDHDYISHSYIPYDHPVFVAGFMRYWAPKAVFWVESEFWPETLHQIKARNIPAFLLNLRLSTRSTQKWQKHAPQFIQNMLSCFSYVQAQTDEYAQYYKTLTNKDVDRIGNLKYAAPALACDQDDLEALSDQWANRDVLLFASTHEGEEELALDTFKALQETHPQLLLIIAPRHPERGKDIPSLLKQRDINDFAMRSQPQDQTDLTNISVYVADSLGELGLFFALSPICVMGNSFIHTPGGGHNPLEPAHFNCSIIYGPSMYNFQIMHEDLQKAEACIQVQNQKELQTQIAHLLNNSDAAQAISQRAYHFTAKGSHILDDIYGDIKPMLPLLAATNEADETL